MRLSSFIASKALHSLPTWNVQSGGKGSEICVDRTVMHRLFFIEMLTGIRRWNRVLEFGHQIVELKIKFYSPVRCGCGWLWSRRRVDASQHHWARAMRTFFVNGHSVHTLRICRRWRLSVVLHLHWPTGEASHNNKFTAFSLANSSCESHAMSNECEWKTKKKWLQFHIVHAQFVWSHLRPVFFRTV